MSLGLQCLLLLAISSSLLALPARIRRGDNFERSFGSRVSRDTEKSASKGEENINEGLFEGDIKLKDGQELPITHKKVKREVGSGDGAAIPDEVESSAVPDEVEPSVVPDTVEPSAVPDEKAFKSRDDLWKDGKVPYKFATTLSPMYRDILLEAMKWWSNATGGCVSFDHASENDIDFLLFRKDSEGCSSYVGRQGGKQYLNISSTCSNVGNAAHEIGHALGLWHEHSRPDRDTYINVLTENIKSEKIADQNFGLLSETTFSKVPPVSYDIESIMHYGAHAFTNDQEKKTIEVRDDAPWDMCDRPEEMGQRERISHKDTLRIKLLYGCGDVNPMDMPMPTSCEAPTPTPTSTPIPSPSPTPTLNRKLVTNNVITLQFKDKKFGMRCVPSPGCTPTPCSNNFGSTAGHCAVTENEFRIIRPGNSRIGSGDKVLLRSVYKPSMWLNCSGINNECTISPCTSNAADPSNSSYISECEDHFFIIKGANRGVGKVLSTKHMIQFKSFKKNKYLNCVEKRCRLLDATECPTISDVPTNRHIYANPTEVGGQLVTGRNCAIQNYTVTKIREY